MIDLATPNQRTVIRKVLRERDRQDEKWGTIERFDGRDSRQWLTILMEEVGEVAEAMLHEDDSRIEQELVQVAAVAAAMLESFSRKPATERSSDGHT